MNKKMKDKFAPDTENWQRVVEFLENSEAKSGAGNYGIEDSSTNRASQKASPDELTLLLQTATALRPLFGGPFKGNDISSQHFAVAAESWGLIQACRKLLGLLKDAEETTARARLLEERLLPRAVEFMEGIYTVVGRGANSDRVLKKFRNFLKCHYGHALYCHRRLDVDSEALTSFPSCEDWGDKQILFYKQNNFNELEVKKLSEFHTLYKSLGVISSTKLKKKAQTSTNSILDSARASEDSLGTPRDTHRASSPKKKTRKR
jgi:hypothetical protein